MRPKFQPLVVVVLLTLQTSNDANTQDSKTQTAEPKTKLEAFQAKSGAVIIRGFSRVGSLERLADESVEVKGQEFTDASSGKKEYGITVTVESRSPTSSRLGKESTSYIDYDEIDSLVKGIDYIAKIDETTTKLAAFQADYHTKGDLIVSTYSNQGGVRARIQSGRFGGTSAFLSLMELEQFKKLILKAKEMLDEIKK